MKIIKREVFYGFHKALCSRPVAFGILETFEDQSFRYLISSGKTFNHNALQFEKLSELESYISSKGWF